MLSFFHRSLGISQVAQRLGYLPLALAQIGTYMRVTKTGCSKYLDLYEASYERVCQNNQTAGRVLQLWAYLHYQDVWYETFRWGSSGGLQKAGWVHALAGSELIFKRMMKSSDRWHIIR